MKFTDYMKQSFKENPKLKLKYDKLDKRYKTIKNLLNRKHKRNKRTFTYKNYIGTIKFSKYDNCYYGKLLLSNKDLVNYEAKTISRLYKKFRNAINDYIEFKEEIKNKMNNKYNCFEDSVDNDYEDEVCND